MKCMFTGREVDETMSDLDPEDAFRRKKRGEELSKWEQLTVTILRNGHPLQLLVGMVAPEVQPTPGALTLSLVKE